VGSAEEVCAGSGVALADHFGLRDWFDEQGSRCAAWGFDADGGKVAVPVRRVQAGRSGRRTALGTQTHDHRRAGRGRRGSDPGIDPGTHHPLVPEEDGRTQRTFQVHDRPDLERVQPQTPPDRRIQTVQRPDVRGQGLRHRRALPQPSRGCRGVVRRREIPGPGAGQVAAGLRR